MEEEFGSVLWRCLIKKKDAGISELFEKQVNSITDNNITEIVEILIADWEAIVVSTKLNIDERIACGMHDGDYIGKAATSKLTRLKKSEL